MKKKIFSTLLLVVFALTSTSVFVSCKDYEDDINANRNAIDALQATVNQLQTALATCQSNCQANKAAFETWIAGVKDAKTLQDAINQNATAISNLQAALDALKADAATKAELAALQAALDAAKATLQAAIDGKASQAQVDQLASLLAGINEPISEILKKYATVDQLTATQVQLQEQIDALKLYEARIANLETEMAGKLNEAQVKELIAAALQDYATVSALDALREVVNGKASAQEVAEIRDALNNYATTDALNQAVAALNAALEGKANVADLTQLKETLEAALALKADKAALDQLTTTVNTLATTVGNQGDAITELQTLVSQLQAALEEKASKDDIDALNNRIAEVISDLQSKIDAKADKTALDDLIESVNAYKEANDATIGQLRVLIGDKADKTRVEELATMLATLRGEYDETVIALASLSEVVSGISSELANKASVEALNELAAKVDLKANTADVNAMKLALEASIGINASEIATIKTITLPALELALEGANTAIGELQAADVTINGRIDDLLNKLNIATTTLSAEQINIIQYLIAKNITSLVLRPEFYVIGLESVELPALAYQPLISLHKQDQTFDVLRYDKENKKSIIEKVPFENLDFYEYVKPGTIDNPEYFNPLMEYDDDDDLPKVNGTYLLNPGDVTTYEQFRENPWAIIQEFLNIDHICYGVPSNAYYHVNPNTADLSKITDLKFYTNTAIVLDEVESRRNTKQGLDGRYVIDDDCIKNPNKYYEGGILTVPFTANNWESYFRQLVNEANGWTLAPKMEDPIHGSYVAVIEDNVDFIALQAFTKDTTITSDYACVVPTVYHIIGLHDLDPVSGDTTVYYRGKLYDHKPHWWPMPYCCNNSWANTSMRHLYKQAKYAIQNVYTHDVAFDDSLDIFKSVVTHYAYLGPTSNRDSYGATLDPIDAEGVRDLTLLEKLGLTYQFELIDYNSGQNVTEETKHLTATVWKDGKIIAKLATDERNGYVSKTNLTVIPDSVMVTPRSVLHLGGKEYQTKLDEPATREAIDREPLVKVTLLDKFGHTIEAGYIKLKITEFPMDHTPKEFTLPIEGEFVMNCTENGKLRWSQVEDFILGELQKRGYDDKGLIKDEFNEYYELETKTGVKGTPAVLYTYNEETGQYEVDNDVMGKVVEIVDKYDLQTNVLAWEFGTDPEVLENLFKPTVASKGQGTATDSLVVMVKYEPTAAGWQNGQTPLFIRLTVAPNQFYFAYTERGLNKRPAYWYNMNSDNNVIETMDDAKEIHFYAPVPANHFGNGAETPLTDLDYQNSLEFYFLKPVLDIEAEILAKFTKILEGKSDFEFVHPKDVKAELRDGTVLDGEDWVVSGVTKTYTLTLSADNKQVWATAHEVGALPELVCWIADKKVEDAAGGRFEQYVFYNNSYAAKDLLNKRGLYNAKGAKDTEYLSADNTTFTVWIEANQWVGDCYRVLAEDNVFRARFLRPVNVYIDLAGPSEVEWIDGLNKVQYDDNNLGGLMTISARDWRNYLLVENKIYDDTNKKIWEKYYGLEKDLTTYIDWFDMWDDANMTTTGRNAVKFDATFNPADYQMERIDVFGLPGIPGFTAIQGLYEIINDATSDADLKARAQEAYDKLQPVDKTHKLKYESQNGEIAAKGSDVHIYIPIKAANASGAKYVFSNGNEGVLQNISTVWYRIKIHKTTQQTEGNAKRN